MIAPADDYQGYLLGDNRQHNCGGDDQKCAVQAARKLVESDGATCLLGAWASADTIPTAESVTVPDEVVQMLCAAGTAAECRAKVAEYVAAGCTSPILYPLGDVPATLEAFAPG